MGIFFQHSGIKMTPLQKILYKDDPLIVHFLYKDDPFFNDSGIKMGVSYTKVYFSYSLCFCSSVTLKNQTYTYKCWYKDGSHFVVS